MTNEPLLPCPFCENKPEIKFGGLVVCTKCGAAVHSIHLWNTRTPPPPSVKCLCMTYPNPDCPMHDKSCKELNAPKGEVSKHKHNFVDFPDGTVGCDICNPQPSENKESENEMD